MERCYLPYGCRFHYQHKRETRKEAMIVLSILATLAIAAVGGLVMTAAVVVVILTAAVILL